MRNVPTFVTSPWGPGRRGASTVHTQLPLLWTTSELLHGEWLGRAESGYHQDQTNAKAVLI